VRGEYCKGCGLCITYCKNGVLIESGGGGDMVSVSYSNIRREVPLAGIGETLGVAGNTTGHGLNEILYNSSGWD